MSLIMELDLASYALEVEFYEGIILVDFYGNNCFPCKELLPILEEVALDYRDDIKVCKINVSENMAIAKELRVMGLPTLIVYKDGQIVNRCTGVQNRLSIDKLIEDSLLT